MNETLEMKVIEYKKLGDFSAVALIENKDCTKFWRVRTSELDGAELKGTIDFYYETFKSIDDVKLYNIK